MIIFQTLAIIIIQSNLLFIQSTTSSQINVLELDDRYDKFS